MPKDWMEHPNPTAEQDERAHRVQLAVIRELNLQAQEGASTAELLAGLASATADLITCRVGPQAVSLWFARQGEIIASLDTSTH